METPIVLPPGAALPGADDDAELDELDEPPHAARAKTQRYATKRKFKTVSFDLLSCSRARTGPCEAPLEIGDDVGGGLDTHREA